MDGPSAAGSGPSGRRPGDLLLVLRETWLSDRRNLALVLVCAVVTASNPALQVLLTAGLTGAFLDLAGGRTGGPGIFGYLGAMAGAGLAAQLLGMVQTRALQRCQSRLVARLSGLLVRRAVSLSLAQAEDPTVHDAMQRAAREVHMRPGVLLQQLVQLATQAIGFLTVGAVLFSLDYRVALLAMAAPVPNLVTQLLTGRRGYDLEHSRSADRRRLAYWQQLATQPESVKEVLAFRLGPLVVDQHSTLLAGVVGADLRLADRNLRLAAPMALAAALLTFLAQVAAVAVGIAGAGIVTLFAVIQGIVVLQSSVGQLLYAASGMYVNQLYLRNVLEFVAMPVAVPARGRVRFPDRIRNGIELRDVSFTYPGAERPAVRGLSVTLRPGETTAIVGLNGAGKSTAAKLLGRLYEPTGGEVLVDGTPLAEFDLDGLRDRVAYVFQDFVRFQLTVAENIGFGISGDRRGADDDPAIRRAAGAAGLAGHVERLPLGLRTQLGTVFDGGVELSGGQWQALAVARGLVRDASVRIMDEPTAAIDAVAENALLEVLTEVAPQRVTVIIAHRFPIVTRADRVLVLADGELVEDGTPQELLAAGGCYARMHRAQSAESQRAAR
jgi:ATP-binding cassette, subfamily B, bacterial